MTIEKTIQKAIEGGWQTINCSNCLNPWIGHKQTRIGNRYCQRLPDMDRAMLDPLFWQSLGKAMGWADWFYSFYVASHHRPEDEKMVEELHKKNGECPQCGYWEKVVNFEDIPVHLRDVKGAWRKHPLSNPEYLTVWHSFIDHLAQNKTIEEFFNQF